MQLHTTKAVCTMVTNHMTALLTRRILPWRTPWNNAGIPRNLISKNAYRDINVFLLASKGYAQNLFLTTEELHAIGGRTRQGEHGHLVVFAKENNIRDDILEGEYAWGAGTTVMRYTEVFNVAQCEHIPAPYTDALPKRLGPLRVCEHLLSDMVHLPKIRHKEPDPYYNPSLDYINMPKLNAYRSVEAYYGVLFHELVHSTGHSKRLARNRSDEMTPLGGDIFSFEEIIAELGASYLASYTGIAPIPSDTSLEYFMGWVERLKGNPCLIVYAAYEAQRAVDYILKQDTSAAYQDAH